MRLCFSERHNTAVTKNVMTSVEQSQRQTKDTERIMSGFGCTLVRTVAIGI